MKTIQQIAQELDQESHQEFLKRAYKEINAHKHYTQRYRILFALSLITNIILGALLLTQKFL